MAKFIVPARAVRALVSGVVRTLDVHTKKSAKIDAAAAASFSKLFNGYLDACRAAGARASDAATAHAVGKAVQSDPEFALYLEHVPVVDSTLRAYLTSVKRAMFHGVPWAPSLHKDETKGIPTKSGGERKKKAPTATATVKVAKRDRTVLATVPKGIELDDLAAVVAAIQAEPARMALALAWVKSHGWLDKPAAK